MASFIEKQKRTCFKRHFQKKFSNSKRKTNLEKIVDGNELVSIILKNFSELKKNERFCRNYFKAAVFAERVTKVVKKTFGQSCC